MTAGRVYTVGVPGTLDLAERCRLGLWGLANTSDPEDDNLFWFELYWNAKPPYLKHSGCDIECGFKTLDNFFQLRHASGCEDYREREEQLRDFLLGCVEDDGLFWMRSVPKRPWHLNGYASFHSGYENPNVDLASPSSTGGLMTTLALRNAGPGEAGRYDEVLGRMARGLETAAIHRGNYAYYPDGKVGHPFNMPRGGWPDTREPQDEHETGEGTVVAYLGYPVQGLTKWAVQSGDERALQFAGKLVRFGMKGRFWGHPGDPDRMAGWEQGHLDSHFHARAIFLKGLLEYGLVTGERNVLDFVRSSYEHMRSWGINRIGFIPTWVNGRRICMETCLLGDLVALAVRMSDAGIGDYWDDADRMVRNHLAEAQIMDRAGLDRIQEHISSGGGDSSLVADATDATVPLTSQPTSMAGEPCAGNTTDDRQVCWDGVLDRCVGTFLSYLLPASALNWRTMSCCNANGCRGIYYAWEAITRCEGEDGQVNLLLNRAAPWLDVESHLPYEGKVVVRNKSCRRISIRIPSWARCDDVRLNVNDQERPNRYAGRYLVADDLAGGDVVRLDFPMMQETFQRTAHARTDQETLYTITVKGNTVVDIAPRDEDPAHYAFYGRSELLCDHAPVQEVQRRVLEHVPQW